MKTNFDLMKEGLIEVKRRDIAEASLEMFQLKEAKIGAVSKLQLSSEELRIFTSALESEIVKNKVKIKNAIKIIKDLEEDSSKVGEILCSQSV